MWWTLEKLAARINELSSWRYRDEFTIDQFQIQEDVAGLPGTLPPESGEWYTIHLGDTWKGRDRYAWIRAEIDIPVAWHGKKVLGRFDFGRTGGGNNSGFESLMFLNGAPFQGVDSNHKEVFLPQEIIGSTFRLDFRLWSGLNGYGPPAEIEHRLQMARFGWLEDTVDDLYFTSSAILETVRLLDKNRPEREDLVAVLERSFHCIDWSVPGSEDFFNSVVNARNILNDGLKLIPKNHSVHVDCIGHTHIDVAWLWRVKHTREKVARSFSTVLRLMEQYPEYIFLQTQPQLYEYIKQDYPQIYEKILERVREQRWEVGGAMWLEADCNLPSGESLVRQLLHGTRFFSSEFGVECKYLWLPDVFGYCWALPQILRKSGIEAFMTTKISWNQYNRMPHDTFLWRGMDGTEIATHFITTPQNNLDEDSFMYTYNGDITPHSVQGIWDGYQDKALNRNLLLAYGYGDGGGGPNREMLEMRRRIEQLPSLPNVQTGRADEYFEKLAKRVYENDGNHYVHVWDGEMYLETHRGTYTSQAYSKRMNRKLELLYRDVEWIHVLSSVRQSGWGKYPVERLLAGWKAILLNQFHDIIPGSSIREVYEDSRKEYEEAWELGQSLWNEAAFGLIQNSGNSRNRTEQIFAVFNSSSWVRSDVVKIPVQENMTQGIWRDATGRPLIAQETADGWLVQVEDLPVMGTANISFHAIETSLDRSELQKMNQDSDQSFQYFEGKLETPFYRIEWNCEGALTTIYDKRTQREVLASGQRGNVLQVFEDKPKGRHEAWDIDIFYSQKMRIVSKLLEVSPIETGPLRHVVRFHWLYGQSDIVQDLIVYANSPRIDFCTKVEWHERRQLLKVAFPVDIRATEATYDVQFGNVRRPTHWNTSWDYARFESVGHQWADLSEHGYGVSLLNDCKYGYDIKDNVIRLSLIKSAMVPDEEADQGHHEFTYSLLPHIGDWRAAGTVKEAWALNNPLRAVAGELSQDIDSLFQMDVDHLQIDAVKKAEDSEAVILRFHEYMGARGKVTIRSDYDIQAWRETDLLERPLGDWEYSDTIHLSIQPYEIKTIAILLQQAGRRKNT